MKLKQFQYETQSYQEDCIHNIVQIFENLHEQDSFEKTLTEHKNKNQYPFPVQDAKNIDIMMETGTGKTFTFIKTIFELNRNFGYQKFIILIPTVPIREGTKTNLEDTKAYFKGLYANEKEKEIEVFTYEGGNISAVNNFIHSQHLSVLIMTPSSFSSKDNILNRPLEREINNLFTYQNPIQTPKTYLECLKQLNPIVIMDEPHRFDGDAFKKYFEGFNNYYLRFGATFPRKKDSVQLSNVAYVLDSISSFRQNLVKKIVVYTQDIVESIDTLVGIEKKGSKNIALIDTLSNGTIVRREVSVGGIFNGTSVRKINKDNIILENSTIEKVDYSLTDESLRAMISKTIEIHFQKEQMLFEQGIKALSLFFIESDTSLFRGDNPKIKTLFEEEFKKKYDEVIAALDVNSDYYHYLKNSFDADGNLQVHKGYFSGDKGNADQKVKDGVDEILKDKKKLLSFESPTRFIFSIWALQEGWDNPNVFTICKLSNQGSEISKLQQIGRGLRICVDQNLQRKTFKNLGNNQEEFWKINNLDVVVSSKEQGFVESIQNEILSNSFLISKSFTEKEIIHILKEKTTFDDDTIDFLISDILRGEKLIVRKAIIDGERIFEKADNFASLLKEQNLPAEQEKALLDVFVSPAEINTFIQKANKVKEKKKIFIKQSHLQEFKDLWNTINQNAFYVLDTLSEEKQQQLIENIKTDIENLQIDEVLLQTKRSDLNVNKIDRQDAITTEIVSTQHRKQEVNLLAMVQWIATKTKTPLAFVVQIFNVLSEGFKAENLANNPAQAQKEIVKIINKNLINTLKAHIRYDGISGKVLANVFQTENDKTYIEKGSVGKFQKDIDTDFALKEKWIFEEVIEYDSDFELQIIEKDPNISEIAIFGKLPKLKIKTPMGEYNPDFCYAIKGEQGNKVFLVVEAKGYDTLGDVSDSERAKIDFAKKYFQTLNEHYKDQNIKISFKERINRTQLSALVKG
ncbi:DEAD/DEAH box helicase family protein [Capnocytophaga canis]|uniref:Type III restriction enzyme, res subunit n=1 Tax=Capnocytophaga canis TaxID=1848903 RepID=A0A0B7IH99_9FLAO|nr:DEAD/DEAH box helicase family protein [Capnocytophaga canis]CEN51195.1 Type III restriction enzyme, res subunit [Capnocytophaga canis]